MRVLSYINGLAGGDLDLVAVTGCDCDCNPNILGLGAVLPLGAGSPIGRQEPF